MSLRDVFQFIAGNRCTKGDQFFGKEGAVFSVANLLANCAFYFVRVFVNAFERAVLVQKFAGGFYADAFYAGNVVSGVAVKRKQVQKALRLHAPLSLYALRSHDFPNVGVVGLKDLDALADQLHQVLVARKYADAFSLLHRFARDGGDDVVGFVAFHPQGRNAKRFQSFLNPRNLRVKVFGSFGARGLVVGIHFVAEGFSF